MKRSSSRSRTILEDKRALLEDLCEGMNLRDRLLTEEIYNEFHDIGRMISEAQLTQDQIQKLFAAVSKGAEKGWNVDLPGGDPEIGPAGEGGNKTLMGKISGAWQKLKSKIAQSGPVSGFDVTVDKLQKQISAKSGPDGKLTKAIAAYRKFGDKHPIMQGAIIAGLTAAAAMGGGLGVGAVAGVAGGLRTLDRMLMGDRASSALWKGFKVGAVAYGVGSIIQGVQGGQTATDTGAGQTAPAQPAATPAAAAPTGVDTATQTVAAAKGDTLSQIAQKMDVSVKDLVQANPQITNPNDLGLGEIINIPNATGNAVYQGGVGTASDTAAKVASGEYTPSRYGIKESVDWNKIRNTFAIQESMKMPLKSAVYLTPYGVQQVMETIEKYQDELDEGIWDAVKAGWNTSKNKITTDKLDLWWRRNRGENPTDGPVDKQVVVDFLKKMGVKSGLVDRAFKEVGIPDEVNKDNVPPPVDDGGGDGEFRSSRIVGPNDSEEYNQFLRRNNNDNIGTPQTPKPGDTEPKPGDTEPKPGDTKPKPKPKPGDTKPQDGDKGPTPAPAPSITPAKSSQELLSGLNALWDDNAEWIYEKGVGKDLINWLQAKIKKYHTGPVGVGPTDKKTVSKYGLAEAKRRKMLMIERKIAQYEKLIAENKKKQKKTLTESRKKR